TLAKIAEEKAGIMKAGVTCVLGEFHEETHPVFKKKAQELDLELIPAWDVERHPKLQPQLKGKFQETNAHLAYLSCLQLVKNLPKLSETQILDGISRSQHYFFLPGRWQILQENPLLIFDMAHNKAGLDTVKAELQQMNFNKLHVVWAMAADKSVDDVFKALPKNARYYLSPMDNPRSLNTTQLQDLGERYLSHFEFFAKPEHALNQSLSVAKQNDIILVAGSMFLVSELFSIFFSESLAELKKRSIFAPIKR
ncbi:MAG: glutamate ligase domain-containing protein, partial [Flavobacteriales bacterium]